ncbi:MAG: hypothetical protein HY777_06895, partial [Betaproteobacteria bacterium]|nr:hypothetical protein [Betaproteobacteria bacterium]
HKIDGKPMALLARALEINDKEEKALELLGVAAYQNKNFAQAAFYWRQLLKAIPGDSGYARDIAAAAEEAEQSAARFSGLGDRAQLGARSVAVDRMKRNAGQPAHDGARSVGGTAIGRVLP